MGRSGEGLRFTEPSGCEGTQPGRTPTRNRGEPEGPIFSAKICGCNWLDGKLLVSGGDF